MDSYPAVTRRDLLLGGTASPATSLEITGTLGTRPARVDTAIGHPAEIQFDIGEFSQAAASIDGTIDGSAVQLAPVHTVFLTAQLLRRPFLADQAELTRALTALEIAYPWGAAGLITLASYGIPYFDRLDPAIVGAAIPRLAGNPARSVLQEAVPGPAGVRIERHDTLFTLRSDRIGTVRDVVAWLSGSNVLRGAIVRSPAFGTLLRFTGSRHMFSQQGLPRQVATHYDLSLRNLIDPSTSMWTGRAGRPIESGTAATCTFQGNPSTGITTATPGSYFGNGSIQHLCHTIVDLEQFFGTGPAATVTDPAADTASRLTERIRATFRLGRRPCPRGSQDAAHGTPGHLRMDGPGFDNLDVPDQTNQPKLHSCVFVPTTDDVPATQLGKSPADVTAPFHVDDDDNGPARFLTATRRQNFLIPPRRHRAFPLVELGA